MNVLTDPTIPHSVYIAGPMTGYHEHNFPAFRAAAAEWRARGWFVVSPAEMDDSDDHAALAEVPWDWYLRRDLVELVRCTAIAVLPGWRKSKGASLEVQTARALGMKVYDAQTITPLDESALQEAQRLVHGDRGADYGHPIDDFTRTGRMWGAILDLPDAVPPEKVGLCMAAVKISREVNAPKRDNRVDLAGYAETVDMVMERKGQAA